MRIYLAGPMTGYPDLNFPLFDAEAKRLRAKGHEVVNPAEVKLHEGAGWTDYMRADLPLLCTCEAIALLPDWHVSNGAFLEHFIARSLQFQVFTAADL